MASTLTRREFIRITGVGTAGALALGTAGFTFKNFGRSQAPGATPNLTTIPTVCEICFWKCGAIAHLEDGRLWKLEGNPADPLCNGRLCPRGTAGMDALYDPDRLAKPLLRVHNRGADEWEATTWENALDHIAEKLLKIKDRYGPEALAVFNHGGGGSWFKHLALAFGSPNVAQPSFAQCRGPRDVAFELTFGEGVGSPERTDIANASMIVLIGSHLGENMHNTQVQEFADAIGNGAHIVAVDPRFSVAASKAHRWLAIRPGTDLALLLAWINVLLEENLYDREYIDSYAVGLPELRQAVAGYTPEWAYPQTGIDAEVIRAVARDMGRHKPGVLVHPGRHATWYGNDTQRSRAIAILGALLGSWGRKGGYYLPNKLMVPPYPGPKYPKSRSTADGAGTTYPFASETVANGIREATLTGRPYPIKAWMAYATNLIQSLPNPNETIEAIQKLDLMVAVDTMPAEITGWADVVLPECTYLERYDDIFNPAFREPFVALRQPVAEPMFDSKPGWWIARELGMRLGLQKYFAWKSIEEYLDVRLKSVGTSLEEMKRKGIRKGRAADLYFGPSNPPAFETPSGTIELFSPRLKEAGFDPVPQYTPPEPNPPGMYRLLYGRSPIHTFGRTTNMKRLAELQPENEVWVNADAAKELDLQTGDVVVLTNQDGVVSAPIKVKVTERIHPEAVYMVHGFGHTSKRLRTAAGKGADDTALITKYKTDPLMGGTGMRGNFVRIDKQEAKS